MQSYWSQSGPVDPALRGLWGASSQPPPSAVSSSPEQQAAAEMAKVEEAQRRVDELTAGRAQELANDPYQKVVMDYLQGVVGGQDVPYTDTVKNSILAQQGSGSAAAEAAQMESLRESLGANGGSIYDPGYQAAQRQAMSQRQGANLNAQGQVNMTAGLENHQARMQGAGQLATARGAQNAQINQMNIAAADQKAKTFADTPAVPAQPQQPQFQRPVGRGPGYAKTAGGVNSSIMGPGGSIRI